MLGIINLRLMLIILLIFITTASHGFAAPKQIKLPTETARLPESKLSGYYLATQKCMICHSVDYIRYQPPGMDQAQWTAEVAKMKNSYGASLSEAEIKSIGAYLAVVYGSAESTDSDILAVADMQTLELNSTQSDREIDVQQLLKVNGCLGCHAIDKVMIGPSFKDIAVKYKQALAVQDKLANSIQKGGAGKWGPTPMPAMANLNEEQARALAKFVLEQGY